MIIKIIQKHDNGTTKVFSDITDYSVLHKTIGDKGYYLSFNYKEELIEYDLLSCQSVYIMNDHGATIDTLRRL